MAETDAQRIHRLLRETFSNGFGLNLDEKLLQRNRQLWILGLDNDKRQLRDVLGIIDPTVFAKFKHKYQNNEAGFRADAHITLGLQGVEADAFMLNDDNFKKPDDYLVPIMVHELAHYMEQTNVTPVSNDLDNANAAALRVSLIKEVSRLPDHNIAWARHLVVAARKLVASEKTGHKTIKAFVEVAIPPIDRDGSIPILE